MERIEDERDVHTHRHGFIGETQFVRSWLDEHDVERIEFNVRNIVLLRRHLIIRGNAGAHSEHLASR